MYFSAKYFLLIHLNDIKYNARFSKYNKFTDAKVSQIFNTTISL